MSDLLGSECPSRLGDQIVTCDSSFLIEDKKSRAHLHLEVQLLLRLLIVLVRVCIGDRFSVLSNLRNLCIVTTHLIEERFKIRCRLP